MRKVHLSSSLQWKQWNQCRSCWKRLKSTKKPGMWEQSYDWDKKTPNLNWFSADVSIKHFDWYHHVGWCWSMRVPMKPYPQIEGPKYVWHCIVYQRYIFLFGWNYLEWLDCQYNAWWICRLLLYATHLESNKFPYQLQYMELWNE